MATPVYINLQYKTSFTAGLWRLKVWVASTEWCPQWIFLMRALPELPATEHDDKAFIRVCSYSDLMNYPALETDEHRCHYRIASLDLTFSSLTDLEELLTGLETDIGHLADDIYNVSTATAVNTSTVIA